MLDKAPRHEDVLGSGGKAPRILDLGTRWRWVVSFTTRPLYPQGKIPWYPLYRRLGGPQSRSGHGGEEKIPSSRRESNPRTPIVQPVAQRYVQAASTPYECLLLTPPSIWGVDWGWFFMIKPRAHCVGRFFLQRTMIVARRGRGNFDSSLLYVTAGSYYCRNVWGK
jgi:hypothetical protein